MSRKALIFIATVLAITLSACGTESTIQKVDTETPASDASGSSPSTSASGDEASTEAGSQGTDKEEPAVYGIGDTVQFDDLYITLNSVSTSQGGEFINPSNDKFLLIDLTIENKGEEPESVSSLMQMSLADAEGYQYNITIYPDAKGTVDGEIGVGRKIRGEVVFDVPDSEYYEFIFENPFTTGQAIWKFEAN